MAKKKMDSYMEYLFNGILSLETVDDCMRFFEDLCTVTEVIEMSKRLCAAKMLADDLSYVDIIEKTGLSSATISRVKRSLTYGSDGYAEVIKRLDEKELSPWREEGNE